MKHFALIELSNDGWWITINGSHQYHWNHNEPDLGVNAISVLLQDLGVDVQVNQQL